jgi:hypothetical protein
VVVTLEGFEGGVGRVRVGPWSGVALGVAVREGAGLVGFFN